MTSNAIELTDIGFTYPGETVPALDGVSLSVAAGSCFGLLGPNGAGKTTLLSILTGILPVQRGRACIGGHRLPDAQLQRHAALVPQEYAFYGALSARENLDCFAGLYGLRGAQKRARIDFAVQVCALAEVLDKPAARYSGGVKRRLNLAIGLLNKPAILYLDEPTVGIDAQSRHFILESIRQLQREGMTIVYTSHYMEEIQSICDALAVIDHGRLLLSDTLANLLGQDAGNTVRLVLDAPPTTLQRARLAVLGDLQGEGDGQRLQLRLAAGEDLDSLLAAVREAGLGVRQLQYGISRLEDIYLAITEHALRD